MAISISGVWKGLEKPTDLEGGGKILVETTPVALTFNGKTIAVIISADSDNTGTLYIGKSDVDSEGNNAIAFLQAGETLTIDYDDYANTIYVVASTTSQYFWKGALL